MLGRKESERVDSLRLEDSPRDFDRILSVSRSTSTYTPPLVSRQPEEPLHLDPASVDASTNTSNKAAQLSAQRERQTSSTRFCLLSISLWLSFCLSLCLASLRGRREREWLLQPSSSRTQRSEASLESGGGFQTSSLLRRKAPAFSKKDRPDATERGRQRERDKERE